MSDVYKIFANNLFRGLSPSTQQSFVNCGAERKVGAGAYLLKEAEPARTFFLLLRGSVKVLYKSPDGTEVVVKIFAAPAAFGEIECLCGYDYLESVVALEKVSVIAIPKSSFLDFLASSPALTRNILNDVAMRFCITAQNERSLAFHAVETRLADLMCTYIEMFGLKTPSGMLIRIPLSQEDLANAMGVARRSVTRTIKNWTRQKILGKQRRHFIIHDLEQLRRLRSPSTLSIGYTLAQ